MTELNYENYAKDLSYIWQNTPKNKKKKHYFLTDQLGDEYLIKKYELYLKYRKTKDIDLKFELDYIKDFYKFKIYLYLIICSYYNRITDFYVYYKEDYLIKDQNKVLIEYNKQINTMIRRLKQGLKLNITIPHSICVKFMNQIKNYNSKIYNFIKNNYLNKCRKTFGICHLPNGKKIYITLLKHTLQGIKKTPKEIHNLGLSLLTNFNYTVKREFYTSRESLYKDCNEIALYIYDHIIDKYFHYKPDKPFTLNKLPLELENSSAMAHYDPNVDIVYINLSIYQQLTKATLYPLLMHECLHQYHHRFMWFLKLKHYQMFGYDNLLLIEGFAHYMETYCEYYDDNNDFSTLRKLRLVVDTGINYYGWSYEKSFNFMIKYLPHKRNDIITELDRYVCNPTQSLCYVLGKIEIIKMRDKFLKEKKGSIKDFHYKLLVKGTPSFLTLNEYIF
jgi:uncharacterized protein (DUF885 family)